MYVIGIDGECGIHISPAVEKQAGRELLVLNVCVLLESQAVVSDKRQPDEIFAGAESPPGTPAIISCPL